MTYVQIIASILVLTVSISGTYLINAFVISETEKSKNNSLILSTVFAVVSLAVSVFGLKL
jgi:hypothetical protein